MPRMSKIAGLEVWLFHSKKRLEKMIKTYIMPVAPSVFLINVYIGHDVSIVFLHKRGSMPGAPLVFLIQTTFEAIPLFDQECKAYILAVTEPTQTRISYTRPAVAAPRTINVVCRPDA